MATARTRIKICGITSLEDAFLAIDAGADALGFIFAPGTPRYVGDRTDIEEILQAIPPFVERVGVCMDISAAASLRGRSIDAIQLYFPVACGEELLKTASFIGKHLLPAFRIRGEESFPEIEYAISHFQPSAILLDAFHPGSPGGSGMVFNWELAREAKVRFNTPVALAGGLTPDNVAQAVRSVNPYAVDVSSGVESAPGIKDRYKIQSFIEQVRSVSF